MVSEKSTLLPISAESDLKKPIPSDIAVTQPGRCARLSRFFIFIVLIIFQFYVTYSFVNYFFQKSPSNSRQLLRVNVSGFRTPAAVANILNNLGADIWSSTHEYVDFLSRGNSPLLDAVRKAFPSVQVIISNVDELLERGRAKRLQYEATESNEQVDATDKKWFKKYHKIDKIYDWYKDLEIKFPHNVRLLDNIGKTHEGRDIMAISITNQTLAKSFNKSVGDIRPRFYIQAGIHAREWISSAVCQFLAYQLASSSNDAVASLLNEGEFLIVPMVNPDGYHYTWSNDRLWRKNRVPIHFSGKVFHGVDLNRNFDSNWGNGGSSDFPASEIYMGPSPASENEVQAITKLFDEYPNIVMALDLHSYSQLILRPIGWDYKDSPHEFQLSKVSDEISNIIYDRHKKHYKAEKSIMLYPTTGSADDWFYMQEKVFKMKDSVFAMVKPYSLTIELRPDDSFLSPGFDLDESEIIPTGEEIVPAVLHLAKTAIQSPLVIFNLTNAIFH